MLSAGESQRRDERDDEEGEQYEAAAGLPPGARRRAHGDREPHRHRDADRQRPRLPQQELAQRPQHHATALGRGAADSARTIACETTTHTASTTSSPASPSGQSTPRPSAQKNVPNVVSTSPTTDFRSLSGRRRSGRCRSSPSPITSTTAAAPPTSAGARPPGRAASTVTMRMTSTPSSSTPLNATTKPGQSKRPAAGGSSSASASRSARNSA